MVAIISPFKENLERVMKTVIVQSRKELNTKGLVPDKSYGKTRHIDLVGIAKEMVQELRGKGCDLIVCLSHLGFSHKQRKLTTKNEPGKLKVLT